MATGIQQDDGSFLRKDATTIETEREDEARNQFGSDVDLSQPSPVKQLLDVGTLEHARIWEVMEDLYYSGYYEDATGVQLDKILSLANIERRPRISATGAVIFQTNDPNNAPVTIPRGTRVTTLEVDGRPRIPFKTVEVATLPAETLRTDPVPVKALEPWETELSSDWLGSQTNVPPNTIDRMVNPIRGIDHVYNPYPTGDTNDDVGYDYVRGRDAETDHELRRRWEQSLGSEGKASLDAIRANVLEVPGVTDVAIEENTSMQDNRSEGGLPPKSFRVTALGGANSEIAHAITDTRAAGVQPYGDVTATTVTSDGIEREASFDRADDVTIYVDVDLVVEPSFPANGNKRVEDAIVEYIGGNTVEGEEFAGQLEMGDDVRHTQVFKRVLTSTDGVVDADVFIGRTEPPVNTDDVAIGRREAASTAGGAITVTNDR